jgi:hypothetical protein
MYDEAHLRYLKFWDESVIIEGLTADGGRSWVG